MGGMVYGRGDGMSLGLTIPQVPLRQALCVGGSLPGCWWLLQGGEGA